MKCNPVRWLWGLLGLIPLLLLALFTQRPSIEADLAARVQEALKRSGHGWAQVVFEGRDGSLGGKASEDGEPEKALQVVHDTFGVRVVSNASSLIDKADKYEWTALKRDNRVRINGFVPNEKTRLEVLGMVKASFPGLQVEDHMKLARGAPPVDVWMGGVGFALKQLTQLKSGQVDLVQTGFNVSGEANDLNAYRAVKTALGSLPKGIQLKGDAVRPPLAKPYAWTAKHVGGQVVIGGHVPNEKVRDDLLAQAKQALPKARVVDEMQLADGAPEGFAAAAAAAVSELAGLDDGRAEIKDMAVSISGTADSQAKAGHIRASLKKAVPGAFKTTEALKYREAAPPAQPAPSGPAKVASPYVTSIFSGSGTAVLSGSVPSEQAKATLIEAAKQRFKGSAIVDQIEIAGGQPAGWQTCLDAGLAAVQRIGRGRALLTDRRLEISGVTDSEDLVRALPKEVASGVGGDCDSNVRLTLNRPAPIDDGRAKAEAEAKAKAEADAKAKAAAADARAKAEADARARAEADARAKAEADARAKAEADARAKADADARAKADASRQTQANTCQEMLRTTAKEGVINFRRASAELDPNSFATLRRLAEVTGRCTQVRIEIEGHTDTDGTPERNQRLSERRAQAVADFLTREGVPSERLTAIGYGETHNVAPNDTPENKAKNRRIEFTVK